MAKAIKKSSARGLLMVLWLILFLPLAAFAAERSCRVEPPRAVAPPATTELSLATQNLWRLSATEQSPALLAKRLRRWAEHIGAVLGFPHILVLQEVDSANTLAQLTAEIVAAGGPQYQIQLIEGQDPSGIDVAVLTRSPVQLGKVQALFAGQRQGEHWLFSRPPLRVEVQAPVAFVLLAVHLRSGHQLDDRQRGPWVQSKRRAQAQTLRQRILAELAAGQQVIVAGDLNSAPGQDLYAEPWSILAQPPLWSAWQRLPPAERFSYRYRCQPQAIDHILLSPGVAENVSRVAVSRGHAGNYAALYADQGAGTVLSDHDALTIYLRLPATLSAPARGETE